MSSDDMCWILAVVNVIRGAELTKMESTGSCFYVNENYKCYDGIHVLKCSSQCRP